MPILNQFWERKKEQVRTRYLQKEPFLPTGFEWLDFQTDGLPQGKLTIIGASPGGGKTTLALQMARNIADSNKRVLFVSLEMTGEELAGRMFCEMYSVDHGDFSRAIPIKGFKEKNKSFQDYISEIDFEVVDDKGFTFQEINNIMNERYTQEVKPDVIFIDYLQLISKVGKRSEKDALDEFLRHLVEFAKKTNIAIVLLSQLNREGQKANLEPKLTDLKGTGAIDQEAYLIIFPFSKKFMKSGIEDEKYYIKIGKNRAGQKDIKKEVMFEGRYFRFKELDIPYGHDSII